MDSKNGDVMLDFSNKPYNLFCGNSIEILKQLPDNSVDSVVTDPPYGLSNHTQEEVITCLSSWISGKPYEPKVSGGFMGKSWDAWVPGPEIWKECFRVLKPGGHIVVFAGTRSMDLMSMAIRLSGFELRDNIGYAYDSGSAPLLAWTYGSGMPKGLNVGKAIDKQLGSDTAAQWEGWNTSLKPSWEPIILARKPLEGNVVQNVLQHGTGALNVDACRVPVEDGGRPLREVAPMRDDYDYRGNSLAGRVDSSLQSSKAVGLTDTGRWPGNVVHDGSDDVLEVFPTAKGQQGSVGPQYGDKTSVNTYGDFGPRAEMSPRTDGGSAARFFYCAKASKKDRDEGLEQLEKKVVYKGNHVGRDMTNQKNHLGGLHSSVGRNTHATVKPTTLMEWLTKLVTPPGGVILDPFNGSGSTGKAAMLNDFKYIGIDLSQEYIEISEKRIQYAIDNKDVILGRIRGSDKPSEDKQLKMTSGTVTLDKAKQAKQAEQASKLNKFFDIEN